MKPSELFSDPSKWTKGFYAKNEEGKNDYARSPKSVSFCIVGAFMQCYPSEDGHERAACLVPVIEERFPDRLARAEDVVVQFNDHPDTTFEEVISVLQQAGE